MYYVYAIKSEIKDWIYVGLSENVPRRVDQHNAGRNRSTKPYRPFTLFYTEEFETRVEARLREKYFKTSAGKRKLRAILNSLQK